MLFRIYAGIGALALLAWVVLALVFQGPPDGDGGAYFMIDLLVLLAAMFARCLTPPALGRRMPRASNNTRG